MFAHLVEVIFGRNSSGTNLSERVGDVSRSASYIKDGGPGEEAVATDISHGVLSQQTIEGSRIGPFVPKGTEQFDRPSKSLHPTHPREWLSMTEAGENRALNSTLSI